MLGWFAETTLVASGLAVVAALAGRLRSIGPTARHALWLVVLIRLMAPPLVSWPWATRWEGLSDWLLAPTTAHAAIMTSDRKDPGPCPMLARPTSGRTTSTSAATPWRFAFRPVGPSEDLALPEPRCLSDDDDDHDAGDAGAAETVAIVPASPPVAPGSTSVAVAGPHHSIWLRHGLIFAWLTVTVVLGIGQAARILRFRRRLRDGVPAPDDLVDEAQRLAEWLGVRVPELLVIPDLGTPLLWCLGRPKLLLPEFLVKSLDHDRWRGILTHELAHLRRGDHWVSRLELAAGLIWWWNPIYWLARARLDAEAELACDAWVVSTLPKDRLSYAEALFQIGSNLSLARSPSPALGAAGSGRFFERRLTMILHDHVPCRLSPLALLVACLLAVFALPSWSTARPATDDLSGAPATAALTSTADTAALASIVDDDDDDADDDDVDDDDDDADDDDDDDDDVARAKAKAKAEARKARDEARKARDEARKARDEARAKAKADAKPKPKTDAKEDKRDRGEAEIEKEIERALGPDFEKKMEELGERIGKEIESKFGPEFEKKMEALGKEIESKFGPEFQKRMETLGKEMEAKFGPGSDFEKQMKKLGKDLEGKLGPGSEFEKQMKDLGKEMESKFGSDSDFAKKIAEAKKKQAEATKTRSSDEKARGKTAPAKAKEPTAAARSRRREHRIAALEAQIAKLAEELKALKAEDDDDE